jgi:hypothetical protein
MTQELLETELLTVTVPLGRWLKRIDERSGVSWPVLAYGMESCVLVIWSDGKHTTKPVDAPFPASNWKVWEIE